MKNQSTENPAEKNWDYCDGTIHASCGSLNFDCLVSYPLFEFLYLGGSEAVGLGDQRNHIDFILQGLHELYINRAKPAGAHGLQLAF